jgi:hypothetical protein
MNIGLVRDENGKVSSTRLVLMVMLTLFCYLAVAGQTVDPTVWTTISSVMLLALGSTSIRSTVKHVATKAAQ